MVEGQHFIEEEQARIGNAQFILGVIGQALDLANGVVGKKTYCTGSERRQSRQCAPACGR